MIKLLVCLLFIPSAFALEAVVTVLEAPMFKYQSYDAPVVQYLRKGDIIRIHPSIANESAFDEYAPSPERLAEIRKKINESSDWNKDPLFQNEKEHTYYSDDEFIPTHDRQGHTVYVLSEHIYIYFKDTREFSQRIGKVDKTDYRLEEPLPKKYPLEVRTGYRGQFNLGITQPYFESYPYSDKAQKKGYMSPIDTNITLLKLAPGNYHERLFIGGSFGAKVFENSYTFADNRLAQEKGIKIGLGPTISYDAFKGEKNRINLSGTVMVYLFNQLNISQELSGLSDQRAYRGYSIAPRLNLQYHRKSILEEVDFVLGTSLEIEPATTFRTEDPGTQSSWWTELGNDQFTTQTTFNLGAYFGIQSAY